jgi:hypothetical protein
VSPPIISKDLEKNFEKKETDAEIRNLVSGLGSWFLVFGLGSGCVGIRRILRGKFERVVVLGDR